MKQVLNEDIKRILNAPFIPWEELNGKTILITGATGLIGYNLIHTLISADIAKKLGLTVVALVRNELRARERFGDLINSPNLRILVGTVEDLPNPGCHIDYIVHGASQTASRAFVDSPVETILTSLCGTENLLELGKENQVAGMVYLSSMEVYGHPVRGHKVTESDIGTMSPLDVRNSYPIAKLQCESLCHAYAKEYGLPITIARLTQTFGPGASKTDGRVFAYFGKCVQEKQDIVLKTRGETERSYLYTADAVTAILMLLLKGAPGEAYNVADEDSYCSIAQMAEAIASEHGVRVRYDIQDEKANGYPTTTYMDLDTLKLKSLGWLQLDETIKSTKRRWCDILNEMINRMMLYWLE